jgi:hypothetical protein
VTLDLNHAVSPSARHDRRKRMQNPPRSPVTLRRFRGRRMAEPNRRPPAQNHAEVDLAGAGVHPQRRNPRAIATYAEKVVIERDADNQGPDRRECGAEDEARRR